jgi:hypothetical protein
MPDQRGVRFDSSPFTLPVLWAGKIMFIYTTHSGRRIILPSAYDTSVGFDLPDRLKHLPDGTHICINNYGTLIAEEKSETKKKRKRGKNAST